VSRKSRQLNKTVADVDEEQEEEEDNVEDEVEGKNIDHYDEEEEEDDDDEEEEEETMTLAIKKSINLLNYRVKEKRTNQAVRAPQKQMKIVGHFLGPKEVSFLDSTAYLDEMYQLNITILTIFG